MRKKYNARKIFIGAVAFSLVSLGAFLYKDISDSNITVDEVVQQTPVGDIMTHFDELGGLAQQAGSEFNVGMQQYSDVVQSGMSGSSETSTENTATDTKVSGTIVRVVDGDTYCVDLSNVDGDEEKGTKIRLIGVDTPESVAPAEYRKDNTEEGKTVSALAKEKITAGTKVLVEYDVSPTDRYGRSLAYLYFEDGTMIQDWLLNEGYANVATYPPNVKYADHFAELAHNAAVNKVGLWNGFFEEE